jgi:hypothetical protein
VSRSNAPDKKSKHQPVAESPTSTWQSQHMPATQKGVTTELVKKARNIISMYEQYNPEAVQKVITHDQVVADKSDRNNMSEDTGFTMMV